MKGKNKMNSNNRPKVVGDLPPIEQTIYLCKMQVLEYIELGYRNSWKIPEMLITQFTDGGIWEEPLTKKEIYAILLTMIEDKISKVRKIENKNNLIEFYNDVLENYYNNEIGNCICCNEETELYIFDNWYCNECFNKSAEKAIKSLPF